MISNKYSVKPGAARSSPADIREGREVEFGGGEEYLGRPERSRMYWAIREGVERRM